MWDLSVINGIFNNRFMICAWIEQKVGSQRDSLIGRLVPYGFYCNSISILVRKEILTLLLYFSVVVYF